MTYEQLKSLIEGQTENPSLDFKADSPLRLQRLAKDIIAMSNVRDGGLIVIGVSDGNLTTYNKDHMKDKLTKYTDPPVDFDLHFPSDNNGKTFVVIKVHPFKEIPVICELAIKQKAQKIIGSNWVHILRNRCLCKSKQRLSCLFWVHMLRNRPGSIPRSTCWVHILRNHDGAAPNFSLNSSLYAVFGCIYAGMAEISAPFQLGLTAGYWVHILRIMHKANFSSKAE